MSQRILAVDVNHLGVGNPAHKPFHEASLTHLMNDPIASVHMVQFRQHTPMLLFHIRLVPDPCVVYQDQRIVAQLWADALKAETV